MSDKRLALDKEDLIAVLRDLNLIVVSLDRIGSHCADLDEPEHNALLANFVINDNVFKKLASMRSILSEPFSDEPDSDELEREMEDLKYWSYEESISSQRMKVG